VDVAIVEPDGNYGNHRTSPAILADPPTVPSLTSVILFGARSHNRRGWINGALQVARDEGGRIWKKVWIINEFGGGFAKQGDSGGPVVIQTSGEVLGHLVCALGNKYWWNVGFNAGLYKTSTALSTT
jgi:hypothetical protein